MTNHTTTLETSRKLKEAGFPQKTEFYWVITSSTNYHLIWYPNGELPTVLLERNDCYAAPIMTEILEQLPRPISVDVQTKRTTARTIQPMTEYGCSYHSHHGNPTEATALLWLKLLSKDES